MTSSSQPALTRVALSALDVNKHLNSPLTSPKKSPTKNHNFVFNDNSEQSPAGGLKDKLLEASFPASRPTSPIRVASTSPATSGKRKDSPTSIVGREDVLHRAKLARVGDRLTVPALAPKEAEGANKVGNIHWGEEPDSSQEIAVSAGSPCASPNTLQDNSQLTAITEPDIAPNLTEEYRAPPSLPSTTATELRENAAALRLCLQYAMYKVKTNQLDIPISRLELLSPSIPSKSAPTRLPQHAETTYDVPPDTAHAAPDSPPGSATPKSNRRQLLSSALPPHSPSPSKMAPRVTDMATPLPQHMQSAVTPARYDELTSSGVKGRAVDGLLSLMGNRK